MAGLFAPRTGNNTIPISNSQATARQDQPDPVSYAKNMLQRSGGDARAAFYLAAKEKGVDPNIILNQVKSMGNPQGMIQNALMGNSKMGELMSLLSMIK